MGSLIYGNDLVTVLIEDRALRHLQLVIAPKLRRDESFFFSWTTEGLLGKGSVWLSPAIRLYFSYDSAKTVVINGRWLEALNDSAFSAAGLIMIDEPGSNGRNVLGRRSPPELPVSRLGTSSALP